MKHGAVVALKVEEKNGKPHLEPAWMSRDMDQAEPPVVANGVVFGFGNGENTRQAYADRGLHDFSPERIKNSTHAVLYALDAQTGKELYSSGDQIKAFNHFSGLSVANGRVYIATFDQHSVLLRIGRALRMRQVYVLAASMLIGAAPAYGQGAAIDWPFSGNDAQRSGWEKSDSRITKDNIKDFQLVMKMSLDPKLKGVHSLTPPVMIGRLISYRGFKELAFVQGASDTLWAVDADMNRVFWAKHFEKPQHAPRNSGPNAAMCSAAVAATPALTPPIAFGARPRTPTATSAAPPSAAKNLLNAGGFGAPRPAFALSGDGKLHLLNTSTGEDVAPAMTFLPPGAKASSLTDSEGIIYTTTSFGCGGAPNGVWAIDLNGDEPKVSKFLTNSGAVPGLGGVAFGADGTVYAQTSDGALDASAGKWANSVIALTPKDLTPAQYFTAPAGLANTTPVLFTFQERELMVAAGRNGQLYVLDPKALGRPDHKTALSETAPGGSVWGGLSSWQGADGTRLGARTHLGLRWKGSIAAFRLDNSDGKPLLTRVWSAAMPSPEPPVITSGIVFALSAGDYSSGDNLKPTGHATLFAFDGTSGKQLYTTGDQVTAPANLTGTTLANGRVFFTTTDGTLYGFGIFLER